MEAFKASIEYRNSHVAVSKKFFYQAHKEGWVDCRKSIEEEHPKLDPVFLDYEDEYGEDKKVHIVSELPIFEEENIAEPPFSSTTDAGSSEPPTNTTPQEKVGD